MDCFLSCLPSSRIDSNKKQHAAAPQLGACRMFYYAFIPETSPGAFP